MVIFHRYVSLLEGKNLNRFCWNDGPIYHLLALQSACTLTAVPNLPGFPFCISQGVREDPQLDYSTLYSKQDPNKFEQGMPWTTKILTCAMVAALLKNVKEAPVSNSKVGTEIIHVSQEIHAEFPKLRGPEYGFNIQMIMTWMIGDTPLTKHPYVNGRNLRWQACRGWFIKLSKHGNKELNKCHHPGQGTQSSSMSFSQSFPSHDPSWTLRYQLVGADLGHSPSEWRDFRDRN